MADIALRLEDIGKSFGSIPALADVSMSVTAGEYLCLLGPSGSGKTTLLRLISGLEKADSGKVFLFEKDASGLRPHVRRTPMVFQEHSLWPHMTALEQVAFVLTERGVGKVEARNFARGTLERVGLSGLENRRPGALSGGERQRAALARALVTGDRLLLLDEPLSNLDTHLRDGLRQDLKRLALEFGQTVIHVTHDREDAFRLAGRIALFNHGRLAAMGKPETLYARPDSFFTASFLGDINCLRCRVVTSLSGEWVVCTRLGLWRGVAGDLSLVPGDEADILFRPEVVLMFRNGEGDIPGNRFSAVAVAGFRAGPLAGFELAPRSRDGALLSPFKALAINGGEIDMSWDGLCECRVPVSRSTLVRHEATLSGIWKGAAGI